MPRSRAGIFRNERTRSTPLDPHTGLFVCLTKLDAKRAELVQKFVPQSHVGIFRNERTRSTPLDPKLTFWFVLYYLGAFGTIWLPYETRCKTGRTSAKVHARSRVGIFHKECTRSTPLDPMLMFRCISYHLRAFGAVFLPYETQCKTGRTSAKVRATKSCQNFLHESTQSTPSNPKLTF